MRGTVVKRGARWSVVIERDRDPVTGKRRREWHSGYQTRREAERARIELLAGLQRGEHVEPSKLTVGAYLVDRWLPACRVRVRPRTFESYELNVRTHLVPSVGHVRLQALTGDMLNAAYADLLAGGRRDGRGLSPRTVRYLHAIIRRALEDATRWGLVPRNAAERADPPRADRNREAMRTWTAERARTFLASTADDRLSALWLLLLTTGMRRGEALGLGWEHVDLDAARASVRRNLTGVHGRGVHRAVVVGA
jgi:integrase